MIPDLVSSVRSSRPETNKYLFWGLLAVSFTLLTMSTTFLLMAGGVAPWYGWAINVGLAALLSSFVMVRRRIPYAVLVAMAGLALEVVGFVGAQMTAHPLVR